MLNIPFLSRSRKTPPVAPVASVDHAIDTFLAGLRTAEHVDYIAAHDAIYYARLHQWTRAARIWQSYNDALFSAFVD